MTGLKLDHHVVTKRPDLNSGREDVCGGNAFSGRQIPPTQRCRPSYEPVNLAIRWRETAGGNSGQNARRERTRGGGE